MPLLMDKRQVAIAQEAAAGTAEVLVAGDVVLTTGLPTWDPDLMVTPRALLTKSLSPRGHVVGTRAAKISFAMFLRGLSGAPTDPGNLPDFTIPFRACGAEVVVSGSPTDEQAAYTPSSSLIVDATSGSYCTIATYLDGKRFQIYGACGNCRLTFTDGAPVLAEFEMQGVYSTPTDVALLTPTYTTVLEPAFKDAAVSILGFTPKVGQIVLDFGNEVVMRQDPNDPAGFFSAQIVRRNPTLTIDPEEELAGTKDWHAAFVDSTLGAITTGVFPSGGTNYNQLQLTVPNGQLTKASIGDRGGMATAPLEFTCRANNDAGENEWEFLVT